MKSLIFLVAVVILQCSAKEAKVADWEAYKVAHNKQYTDAEDTTRFAVYQANLQKIAEHNKQYDEGLTTYKMGVNQFTDMTHEEFLQYLTKFPNDLSTRPKAAGIFKTDPNVAVPDTVDWRASGAVTGVKDQGACGSCWSFSTTGTLEGQSALRQNNKQSLSEQQLLDCSQNYGPQACNGGWPSDALNYVKDNGITTESQYGYQASQQGCRYNSGMAAFHISGHNEVPAGDENALRDAAGQVGPISVCLDAGGWGGYANGVYYQADCQQNNFNHAVLVVGYGSDNGQDYWLIKNSWGAGWGENGYIRLARNRGNQCGVANKAIYPNV